MLIKQMSRLVRHRVLDDAQVKVYCSFMDAQKAGRMGLEVKDALRHLDLTAYTFCEQPLIQDMLDEREDKDV